MQLLILGAMLACATALPVQQGSLPYCDEVQVKPGFGLGPQCTPRNPSGTPTTDGPHDNTPLYCDQVKIKPGFGHGPQCTPRDPPHVQSLEEPENTSGLPNCKDVQVPAGFGPGPACWNPDLQHELDDFANSH